MTVRMGLVLDCGEPEALAEFWAAALGYTSVGSAGSYVMLLPAEGDGPQLLLQKVCRSPRRVRTGCTSTSTSPTSKPRMAIGLRSVPGGSSFRLDRR